MAVHAPLERSRVRHLAPACLIFIAIASTCSAAAGTWNPPLNHPQQHVLQSSGTVASTSARRAPDTRPDTELRIALFDDHLPGIDRELAEVLGATLRQPGVKVSLLSAAQVCDPKILSPDEFFLYIIPQCRTYPAAGLETLVAFARGRGHVLCLGGPLLDDPLWSSAAGWLNRGAIQSAKRDVAAQHRPFTGDLASAASWQRTCNDPVTPGSWEVVPDGPENQPCFRFWTGNLTGWDGYLSRDVPLLFGPDHGLLTFLAKGSASTRQLVVELQEQDGSRWMAVVDIGPQWQRIGLDANDFRYWPDSPTRDRRGGAGDQLQTAQVRRIGFQLARSHIPSLAPGEHGFAIAEVGTCVHPIKNLVPTTLPHDQPLETLFPRYKVYQVDGPAALRATAAFDAPTPADWPAARDLVCGIARTTGRGFLRNQKWRYIPLLDAVDSAGRSRGSAAWLLLNHVPPFDGSVFAGLGVNEPAVLKSPPALSAVSAIVERLRAGVFLREAGSEQFAYWPGETIRLGAEVVNVGMVDRSAEVCVTVRDAQQQLVRETQSLDLPPRETRRWEGPAWTAGREPATYQVCTELRHAGVLVDRVEHEIHVLETRTPAPDEFLAVRGNDFYVNDRPWNPVGVNYWPLYVSGMHRDDFWAGWLQQRYYDPELVEQDLARMAAIGINLVSIQAPQLASHRNLLDFLCRCRKHNIYVNLFCGLASPLGFREQELKEYLSTARLPDNATIMAYDTIWEPGNYVFQGERRAAWDAQWRDWVIEQYGSISAAEEAWSVTGRRDAQGRLISPPDECFQTDGPWRIMMAAYRRFMDDLTSRKWNAAHRRLRALDPHHLVSFRQGNTLPHDFVFTGTPKHVDFICPEGYAIPPGDDGYYAAGFITKYVHFTTGGKPIVWAEFGQSVWDARGMAPSAAQIDGVAPYHELFYRMVIQSGANGTIPWWWPGGYREEEQSDFGIMNPDGSPRPAAQLIARYGPQLQAQRAWPAATVWFDMDRDAHAGGYWYVCFNTGRDAYRSAVEAGQQLGIRTAGTGTTSANTPLVAVGNQPCDGKSPPKFLNAEFNWLLVQDAAGQWVEAADGSTITVPSEGPIPARICVGNTQEATWLAPRAGGVRTGDVVLQTTDRSELRGRWPLPQDTPYLSDADFGTILLAAPGTRSIQVELRMAVEGRTGFGEKRAFTLQRE